MNNRLSLIVKYVARPDMINIAKEELIKVMSEIRREEGCLLFDLLINQQNSDTFVIYETWESRNLWMQHLDSAHMIAFSRKTSQLFRDFSVEQLTFVEEE